MKSILKKLPKLLLLIPSLAYALIRPNAWEPRWHETCFEKMGSWQLKGVDPSFMAPGRELYMPYMSRLKLNRLSSAIAGEPMEDMKESDLYYNSCIKMKINSTALFSYSGFGGKSVDYKFVTYKKGKTEKFQGKYSRPHMGEDEGGITHITMTDNKASSKNDF